MIYLKSALVAIAALIISSVLYIVVVLFRISRSMPAETGAIAVDVRVFLRSSLFWSIAILSFAAAFYWT